MHHLKNLSKSLLRQFPLSLCLLLALHSVSLAQAFRVSPDTLRLTPSGGQTVTGYVRVSYTGDSTGPGTRVHARISSGSSYFSVRPDTILVGVHYWPIVYTVQQSAVTGLATFTDDTTTRTVVLLGAAGTDGVLQGIGPYYSGTTPKNTVRCTDLKLINTGSDTDTVTSAGWAHDPGGRFTWDSSMSFPIIVPPHDTISWSFCFHAPNDTLYYIDTFYVHYKDASSASRLVTRMVYARATDTTSPDGALQVVGPYWTAAIPEGTVGCTQMRLVNGGADPDTITSITWSHDPAGLFTYDTTVTLPRVLRSHDTLYWSFCFHAPNDTLPRIDTVEIHYSDAYSQARSVRRIIYARATDTTLVQCYGMFAATVSLTEVGDTGRFRLYLSNRLGSSARLDSIHISGSGVGVFRVDTSGLPRTIASHQYDSLWCSFIPRAGSTTQFGATLTAYFTTSDSTHCRTALVNVSGSSAQVARDTATVSLGDTSTHRVPLISDSSTYYYSHRINLVNQVGVRIRIDTCYLTNTQHFYIAQQIRSRFPDTLLNGAHHSVILHFFGDSNRTVFRDTLVATMENALASFYIVLDGYSKGATVTGAVQPRMLTSATDLRMWPNPTGSTASIQSVGLQSVTTEISDALGHVIARHDGADLWQWDARGADGARMPAGTYFVRVEGITALGERVVLTRPLAVTQR